MESQLGVNKRFILLIIDATVLKIYILRRSFDTEQQPESIRIDSIAYDYMLEKKTS